MRLVPVWKLRPGMEVATRVSRDGGSTLLNAGVRLQRDYILQLRKLNIRAIYIHDNIIPDIEIEDVILPETRHRAVGLVRHTLQRIKDPDRDKYSQFTAIKQDLNAVIDDIVCQLRDCRNLTVNLSDDSYNEDYTYSHSVNVAVHSIATAISLGLRRSELSAIGLGAFLHDLGKMFLPHSLLFKPGCLSDLEKVEVQKHPGYGLNLVKARRVFDGPGSPIIYKHHERIDGSGYPQGLTGEGIDVYARICAVADVYDALISYRPYRPGVMPHKVMNILQNEIEGFDSDVIQSFYHHIPAYPIGTFVGLSNGTIGIVVRNTHGFPTRPRVRALCTKDDFFILDPVETELLEKLDLVVDRVYRDHEMPDHIYHRGST